MPALEWWTIALLVDVSIKTALLAILAWAGLATLRVRGAHLRHRVWLLVLVGMLLMPALAQIAPGIPLPCRLYPSLPTAMTVDRPLGEAPIQEGQFEPASPEPAPIAVVTTGEDVPAAARELLGEEMIQADALLARVGETETVPSQPPVPVLAEAPAVMLRSGLAMTVFAVYLLGAAVLMVQLVIGLAWTAGLVRRARQIAPPLTGTGLPARARVAESAEVRVPVTIGCWCPVVLLPADWTSWDESFLAMVLAHEGEHVRRRDTWVAVLAALNCAVYWFHPVAWFLRRRLTDLAERICDDEVIRITGNRSVYAQNLLELAGRITPATGRLQPVGVAMARKANVVKRIEAIIDRDRPLSQRVGTLGALVLLGVVVPLILVAAGLRATDTISAAQSGSAMAEKGGTNAAVNPESAAASIAGLVVMAGDGKPVADAEVRLRCGGPDGKYLETKTCRTSWDGKFAFENLPEGKYRVLAFSGDLASRSKRFREGEVQLGDTSVRLELREAPSLSVKVVTRAEGKAVAGATVHLPYTDTKPDYVCDERGEVTIRGLTPEQWQFEIRAKGYAGEKHTVNIRGSETAHLTVELDFGVELSGTVREETGNGLAGVGINVYPSNSQGFPLDYVKTDAEGNYRFECLPIDKLRFRASKDGYVTFEPNVPITVGPGERQRFDITLRKRAYGGAVRGVVVDSFGNPVSGATINNHGRSSDDIRTTRTAEDGSFLLEDVFKTMTGYHLVVKAKGFAPQLVLFSPGTKGEPAEVRGTLEPGHSIRGKVVDESGAPIAGVWIDAADAGSAGGMNLGETLRTDEHGQFAFDSLPADTPFDFVKSGYSQIRDVKLRLDGEEPVIVTMLSEGVILGRVVDDRTGNVVSPFTVQITFSPDRNPGDPSFGISGDIARDGEQFNPRDGTFRIGDLVRGAPLQVAVEAEGYDRKVLRRVVATGETEAGPVEFRLTPVDVMKLLSIAGRVVNEESKPMAGVQLRLIAASRRPFPRDRYPFNREMIHSGQVVSSDLVLQFLEATTDREGRFRFRDVRGDSDLELVYWGRGVSEDRVEFLQRLSREELSELTIRCQTPGAVRGAIPAGALAEASSIALSGNRGFYHADISATKDSYEVQDVPEGQYELQVYGPVRRSKAAPNAVTRNLLKRIQMEVKSGETVTIDLKDESKESSKPPEDGQAATPKKPSEPSPAATPKESDTGTKQPESVGVKSSKKDNSDIVITGSVVDESGRGIGGARLWLPLKHSDASRLAETTTTETGNFVLNIPAPWTEHGAFAPSWTIWCYAQDHQIAAALAYKQLERKSDSPVQITLKPPTDTSFRVRSPDGVPVRGARVEPLHFLASGYDVVPEQLRNMIGDVTDENGQVLLPELGRDKLFSVQVTADGYGIQELRLRDSAEKPALRNIDLRPAGRLEGRLISEDPTAVKSARVHVYQEDYIGQFTSGTASVEPDEDGRFVVPAFAEGAIELIIQADESLPLRPRIPEDIEIYAGGTTRVEVPFERTVRVRGRVQTKGAGKPVTGGLVSVQYGSFRQSEQVRTDADGRFEANVLAGSVRRQLIITPEEFSNWIVEDAGWQMQNAINVPAGVETFDLPPLELIETSERTGRLVDRANRPVAGASIRAIAGNRVYAWGESDEQGAFTLRLPPGLEVERYDASRTRQEGPGNVTILEDSPLVLRIDN